MPNRNMQMLAHAAATRAVNNALNAHLKKIRNENIRLNKLANRIKTAQAALALKGLKRKRNNTWN
jgi:hypothetical protein